MKHWLNHARGSLRNPHVVSFLLASVLGGCATERPLIPLPLDLPKKMAEQNGLNLPAPAPADNPVTRISETPKPPAPIVTETVKPVEQPPAPQQEVADINMAFEQMPLPSFIQMIYGNILKKNINIDPAIMARQDLVTLRTGKPQTPSQVAEAARLLLKSYGISVVEFGNMSRILPNDANTGYLPEIRRGRALPVTPSPLRPVFQLVELQVVRNTDVAGWIKAMFDKKVNLQEDVMRNAVLLSGNGSDVMAAVEAIQVLDQPLMKGRQSARIEPVYWQAEEFAKKLAEVLQAEGYSASTQLNLTYPVTLLPIQAINSVIVFTGDAAILDHTLKWARELDSPRALGKGGGYFTYQVKYSDAAQLAKTLEEILAGARGANATAADPKAAATTNQVNKAGRVVVNAPTNQLVFQGGAEDYGQLLGLLQDLDRPAKAALIEVTVAEVTLSDKTKLGVEWAFDASGAHGTTIQGGTVGGLSIGKAGLSVKVLNTAGDVRLLLNALATNDNTRILSSPRIMARSGETASIQVGDEVPLITSQQTTPTTGGTGGILQSVQYRNTGIVLKVKPVIHAGDRVDLDVAQEVSNPVSTTTGVSSSPTISTRKVETKLSMRDGATILLGGLIRDNQIKGQAGIPLLKDIPLIGQAFRTDSDENTRTELLVLITTYVVENDNDAEAVTDAFRGRLGSWAQPVEAPDSQKGN